MKILRSRKALSPVVASIILIAVTVAVSIAVAAWMGALTFNFMGTEQVSITHAYFGATTIANDTLTVNVTNSGSSAVIINSATVNGVATTITSATATVTVPGNTPTMAINMTLNPVWVNGYTYNIKLSSQKGNSFVYTAVAPP
jgi:flagellin-like protein